MTDPTPDLTLAPASADVGSQDYSNLSLPNRILARIGASPRLASYAATAVAVALGWVWVIFLTAGVSSYSEAPLGPGMAGFRSYLDGIATWAGDSGILAALVRLCTPQASDGSMAVRFAGSYSMWLAMSVAMMLPSAAPMLRTYGDIAHVAGDKNKRTVPVVVLALGYLTLWALFALVGTVVQLMLIEAGSMQNLAYPVGGLAGGAILIIAGLYQFSSLKDACLEKCRNPFNTLFAQWTTSPWGIFKLGLEQGAFCVGCCWALMLVMLVVGTMNLAWMAFFTLFAIVEKSGKGKVTSRLTGGILIVWGGILVALRLNI